MSTSPNTLSFGLTVERLFEELEDRFPLTNPSPDTSINAIMYQSGQRSVVDWIQSRISNDEDL